MSETVPQEALDMIGKDLVPPLKFEVEKGAIRRLAEAIGDQNPLYVDEKYAETSKYGVNIAPLLMVTTLGAPELQAALMAEIPVGDKKNGIVRGFEVEFFQPLKAGDTVTVTCKVQDISGRESKMGFMINITTVREFKNQKGELIATETMQAARW
ncbi:MAG: MaoC family dehydratase N-terminal domain-containing protein [Dehalococcoidia bacterium]